MGAEFERLTVDDEDNLRLLVTDDAGNTDSVNLGPIDGAGIWRKIPRDLFDAFEELIDEHAESARDADDYRAGVLADYHATRGIR